ncbi:MAG TPA: hypothetical protein VFN78_03580 [Ktedonobacterales bacterium]|nr:hypothetical protein [Ktedonobacterales bacterium]
MRWFWQRRKKPEPAVTATADRDESRGSVATAPRPGGSSGRLTATAELGDELLRFARDLLHAQGARVRAEDDDLLLATLPDGSVARYTTTLARARAEEETTLLAQGAAALETIFDEAAQHSRMVALRLPATADPSALALRWLAPVADSCERCLGQGGDPWLAGAPTCDTCPLRTGRLALRWEDPPVAARILRQNDMQSVELAYRLIGRDRRGRRDEWLRVAFNSDGLPLAPLPLDLLSAALPSDAGKATRVTLATASAHAQERLRPALDALSVTLQQRVADDYQRRIEDITTTHERLRRERPEEARNVEAALERELASLAEVFSVEVEARLESAVFITSSVAQVVVETAHGMGPAVTVDLGRGTVSAPRCAVCDADMRAGRVCAKGHAVCAIHLSACAHCGAVRCPACDPTPLATCALCGDATCGDCATTCDDCGRTFCADHVWRCAESDHTLCLEHVNVCGACNDPLCSAHTSRCGACDAVRCERHVQRCKICGEARCEAHASGCVTCGSALCATHSHTCEQCGQPVCADDLFTCMGCGRAVCACAGIGACASCGADYCAQCRGDASTCPACRTLEAPTDEDLSALQRAAEQEPAINLKRKWQVGRNAHARVYVARGLGREEVWVVTSAGEVAGARRKGWLAR